VICFLSLGTEYVKIGRNSGVTIHDMIDII